MKLTVGGQKQNLLVHRRKTELMLIHKLRLDVASSVIRCRQPKQAVLSLQDLMLDTIAVVFRRCGRWFSRNYLTSLTADNSLRPACPADPAASPANPRALPQNAESRQKGRG